MLASFKPRSHSLVMRQITFHNAGPEDYEIVAQLHVASWRKTYAHIYPQSFLQNEAPEERRAYWKKVLERDSGKDLVILATKHDGATIGFAGLRMLDNAAADAHLDSLHVESANQGLGTGRALMSESARQLLMRGANSFDLWVYDDNRPAIDFYTRLGGVAVERGFEDIYGGRFAHTRIAWHDLPALIEVCAP